MESRIDEQTAESQFKQLVDQTVKSGHPVIIERQGEPVVVMMSVQEYMRLIAPDWLQQAWKGAEERGIDKMTMEEIDQEIAAYRREKALALEHQAQ